MVTATAAKPPADSGARRVLVVEDEFLIRLDIAESLRAEGFEVFEASSADEAIRLLASGVNVGVVFTDVRMPGSADGLDLARYVKTNHPETLIIVTSSYPPDQLDREFGKLIEKPYHPAHVIREIERRLVANSGRAARKFQMR